MQPPKKESAHHSEYGSKLRENPGERIGINSGDIEEDWGKFYLRTTHNQRVQLADNPQIMGSS